MNDPLSRLREHFPEISGRVRADREAAAHAPDGVQLLTAKLLLFTGAGAALDALRQSRETDASGTYPDPTPRAPRPARLAPAIVAAAAAVAHAVQAFDGSERTRLATRTFDLAVVGIGLLSLGDTLAEARRDGRVPSAGPAALASAGLLGILIDRSERRHRTELDRLERRASVVERLVPKRRARLDRVVVHV